MKNPKKLLLGLALAALFAFSASACTAVYDTSPVEGGKFYRTKTFVFLFFAFHDVEKCTATDTGVVCSELDVVIN
jgi:hypothetical protein